MPPPVARVGVFVDAEPAFVDKAAGTLGLSYVQFSGSESPETCAATSTPVIKALRVGEGFTADVIEAYADSVAAVLLDTYVAGVAGGTGRTFDWEAVGGLPVRVTVIVAGGLTPDNVGRAVRTLRPFAVDASSGLEAAPRVKDPERIDAFVNEVRKADEEAS